MKMTTLRFYGDVGEIGEKNPIKTVLKSLQKEFEDNPYKFFNEKDLHFRFMELWYSKYSQKLHGLDIIREYALPLETGRRKKVRRHIDFLIENGETKIGLEFFLGKFLICNKESEEQYFDIFHGDLPRKYCVKKSYFSFKSFKEHVKGDLRKLGRLKLKRRIIVCFFVTNCKDEKKLEKFNSKINECENYLQHEKKMRNLASPFEEKIVKWYWMCVFPKRDAKKI